MFPACGRYVCGTPENRREVLTRLARSGILLLDAHAPPEPASSPQRRRGSSSSAGSPLVPAPAIRVYYIMDYESETVIEYVRIEDCISNTSWDRHTDMLCWNSSLVC